MAYTVVKGDTLSELAVKYKTTVSELAKLNNITDPNYIVVGQQLSIPGETSGDAGGDDDTTHLPEPEKLSSRATIKAFGLQSNTDRTIYATWNWDQDHTEHYEVKWYYDTGDGIWFIGETSTTDEKQSLYTGPSNAKKVKFKVKPIAEQYDFHNADIYYWTTDWSTEQTYDYSSNPPVKPSSPSVKIEKYTLTARLDNLGELHATSIQFQIVKDDKTVFNTGSATISTDSVSYACKVDAGSEYKVRCRSFRDNTYSDWSDYSSNTGTMPATPSGITKIHAKSSTSVYLEWGSVATAKSYDVEYTTKKEYFDGADQTSSISNIEFAHYEKTGLESGEEYFFRVRANNDSGSSGWSEIKSIIIGKDPAAPTTWSSTTTVVSGEPLNLYWVHNSEDNSKQNYAELELDINGTKEVKTIKNPNFDNEEEEDKTSFYAIDTTNYVEGTKVLWRVRTSGITNVYGDWSIQRTVDIYAPPTLALNITDLNGNTFDELLSFPFHLSAVAGPNTQTPTGYHVIISAGEAYETVDPTGNTTLISKGENVYSRYFDIDSALDFDISAGDVDLENNVTYTVTCLVSMNSGLKAEQSVSFKVAWTDIYAEPTAEIGVDSAMLTAFIRPNLPLSGYLLSVYRREFDGSLTEIATGIDSMDDTFVTDPHPPLDFARYRIVAIKKDTGAVSFYDVPAFPVGEKAVVIQWSEEWSEFDITDEEDYEKPPWAGSMLKLPYNIDVSDKYSPDVSLIEYIGRKRPVSYYGTHLGETSTWKVDIPKSDKDTLYALRRLAIWMGDVYVREPSGSGYWANINVSFSQTHCELTIPVSFDITRVEGGI